MSEKSIRSRSSEKIVMMRPRKNSCTIIHEEESDDNCSINRG
jgi:hypothetical protein